jgi:cell division protein FtsB
MVSRSRLKSLLTGLALYAMAAAMVGYFGVNAYTGKYGLNARQELDQEIIALTSELARLKQERAEGRSGHARRARTLSARLRQSA